MRDSTEIGMNRTGMQMSPVHGKALLEGIEPHKPADEGDLEALSQLRRQYIVEADALGSIPAPGTMKGVLKSGAEMITGKRPQVFIDKLAERMAYERGGTRLYDALIDKYLARDEDEDEEFSIDDLVEIRAEEASHVLLLQDAIESMGADPTAQTPSADIVGIESSGLMQVVTDPRTSFAHSLHAALVAELVDTASWELLIALADESKLDKLSGRFTHAFQRENKHLAKISTWHQRLTLERSSFV